MYLLGFGLAWWLGQKRAQHQNSVITPEQVNDLIFYGALGVVLGGRLGYILFYNLPDYLLSPVNILKVWQGGMSFHGGLLGVLFAVWLYGRKINKPFFALTDFGAPLVPLGLGAGRIGNFINGELWGRPTDGWWGMVFPHVDNLTRHPSQLYELVLEGILLFIILWIYSRKFRPQMAVSGLFLIVYSIFRFLVEFVRTPDAHLGFVVLDWMTMGQLLSVPMLIIGSVMLWRAGQHQAVPSAVYKKNKSL
jgi:phosphatidylglycerol:prolipoprotein diacylglycerol transferase